MKKRYDQSAEQQHAYPVENCLHQWIVSGIETLCNPRQKAGRVVLVAFALLASLQGCHERVPEGQVLVVLGETDVTMRELQQVAAGRAVTPASQAALLETLVSRKILAMEAERRGLEASGDFHFALRQAREELLVDALRQDLSGEITADLDAAVEAEIADRPWRYRERFQAALARQDKSSEVIIVDSLGFDEQPPRSLLDARVGDTLIIEGISWRLLNVRGMSSSSEEQRRLALQLVRQNEVEARIEDLIADYRQRGRIRYQKGWGAAFKGAR